MSVSISIAAAVCPSTDTAALHAPPLSLQKPSKTIKIGGGVLPPSKTNKNN